MSKKGFEPIAIVSTGCVFPGASSTEEYWNALLRGVSTFMRTPPELWETKLFHSNDRRNPDKYYDDIVSYPHGFQPPEGLKGEGQRVESYIYTAMHECLHNLGTLPKRSKFLIGSTGVADEVNFDLALKEIQADFNRLSEGYLPAAELESALRWALSQGHMGAKRKMTTQMLQDAIVRSSGRRYPHVMLDAACASSLLTVEMGINELRSNRADVVICGGFFTCSPASKVLFCRLGGSSASGVYPFQERADGTVFGDGAGFVALKRLSDAVESRNQIVAVIRGVGLSSDGKGKSIYAPNVSGQVLAMRNAYEATGLDPRTIQYVEAHGTGTATGDSTEVESLKAFFGEFQIPTSTMKLGSVKGMIGHLGWAAGVASIIKLALSLKNRKIPGQPNFDVPAPNLDLERSPFVINRQPTDWPENGIAPRRACINGFGFGGANAHLIIEEYRPQAPASRPVEAPLAETKDPICVVAAGCFTPDARSWDEYVSKAHLPTQAPFAFPSNEKLNNVKFRIIDRAAAVIDRSQIMFLEASDQVLRSFSSEQLDILRNHTGVVVAQTSSLRRQIDEMKRIYSDAIQEAMLKRMGPDGDAANEIYRRWKSDVYDHIVPANEDSNPGIMPNVTAGRISNRFDLRGPSFSVDCGLGSFSASLAEAVDLLHMKACRVVLVGTASSNILPSHQHLWNEMTGSTQHALAEGAICLGLMRESDAKSMGIRALARFEMSFENSEEMDWTSKDIALHHSRFGFLFSGPDAFSALGAVLAATQGKKVELKGKSTATGALRIQMQPALVQAEAPSPHFLSTIEHQDHDELVASKQFDSAADGFLNHHVVRERPTLPGTFMIEWAMEAAKSLCPDRTPVCVRQIKFKKFIRPGATFRLRAKRDPGTNSVSIDITSDVVAKNGLVLRKGVPHFSCQVDIEAQAKSLNLPPFEVESVGNQVTDPYYTPGGMAYLTGPFQTIQRVQKNDTSAWAVCQPSNLSLDESFPRFMTCPTILDGLLRLVALTSDSPETLIPTEIAKVEFFTMLNEWDLKAHNLLVHTVFDKQTRTAYAQLPDGRLLFRISGLQGALLKKSGSPVQASDVGAEVPVYKKLDRNYKSILRNYRRVFLTGATGFLGSHILGELLVSSDATIECLVRGRNREIAEKRLIANLKKYSLWKPEFEARVHVVLGDLEKPRFGLTNEEFDSLAFQVESIIHCGAKVSWIDGIDKLESSNMRSCQCIMELATHRRIIPVSYMSTIAVFYAGLDGMKSYNEDDEVPVRDTNGLGSGYIGTKLQAERIFLNAHAAGLPVKIFRPGVLVGKPSEGSWESDYFYYRLVQYFITTGRAFRSEKSFHDMTPVDYAAKSILYLGQGVASSQSVFHINCSTPRTISQICDMLIELGYPLQIEEPKTWWDRVFREFDQQGRDHVLSIFLAGLPRDQSSSDFDNFARVRCEKTSHELSGSGLSCPEITTSFFKPYVDFIRNAGRPGSPTDALTVRPGPQSPATDWQETLTFPNNHAKRYSYEIVPKPISQPLFRVGAQMSWVQFGLGVPLYTKSQLDGSVLTPLNPELAQSSDEHPRLQTLDIYLQLNLSVLPLPDHFPDAYLAALDSILECLYHLSRAAIENKKRLILSVEHALTPAGVSHPGLGAIRGFIRSLSNENPSKPIKAILYQGASVMPHETLMAECAGDWYDPIVVYQGPQRKVYKLLESPLSASRPKNPIPESPVFLLTGGGRGIGAFLAQEIAKAIPNSRLAILGRSNPKEGRLVIEQILREYGEFSQKTFFLHKKNSIKTPADAKAALDEFVIRQGEKRLLDTIEEFKRLGIDVLYQPCDISKEAEVRHSMNLVYQKFGKIDFIVHSAGIERSRMILRKPLDEYKHVFNCKIKGFVNLLKSVRAPEITQWINFGSIVSFFGNDGQTDYCAANDCLNSLGEYFNAQPNSCRHVTMNWPAWGEVGMLSNWQQVKDLLVKRGLGTLGSEEGRAWFFKELLLGPKSENQVFHYHDEDLAYFYRYQANRKLG